MIHLISDLHLSPDDDALLHRFTTYLSSLTPSDSLYILGDLFEYWLGDDAAEFLGQRPVEEALARLTANGTKVWLMRGNRDFLVGTDFADRCGVGLLEDEHILQMGDHRILLMHGDSLCTDDLEHQAFRSLVRTDVWQQTFLAKSVPERDAMARAVRYRSENGKVAKAIEIMDVTQPAVEAVMHQHQVRLLIHGHTHRPAIHQFALSGPQSGHRIVLGDWATGPSSICIHASHLELRHDTKADALYF